MDEKDLAQFPSDETKLMQPDTDHQEVQEAEPTLSADQVVRPRRSLKPTIKVRENYQTTKDELCDNLEELWERVSSLMSGLKSSGDTTSLQVAIRRLNTAHEGYKRLSTRYITFLKNANNDEALSELSKAESIDIQRDAMVLLAKDKAELRISHLQETRSHRSNSSKHSSRSYRSSCSRSSTLSDRLLEARINAEQSKVRRSFTEKEALAKAEAQAKRAEAEAQAKRAEAEAEAKRAEARIKILESEMEEEVALAKVRLLEQALSQGLDPVCSLPQEVEDPADRTSDYVLEQLSASPPVCSTVQADNTKTSKSSPPTVPVSLTAPEQPDGVHPDVPSQGQLLRNYKKGHQAFPGLPPQLAAIITIYRG